MDLDTLYANAFAEDTEALAVLEKKADRLNKDERTILHIESMLGNTERVRFILMKFAHKKLLVKLDAFQQTALHLAADFGHTEVVEILIDAARRLPFSFDNDLQDPVSNSLEAFVRQANNKMNTALHLAVKNGHVDIVKLLAETDPGDRHIQNHDDETPVYIAAKLGYNDIVKLICTACTAPSLAGPQGTNALYPVIMKLHQARREDKDVTKVLINAARRSACSEDAQYNSFEALFNITDENGYNVLQLAVQVNNPDAVELILKEDPAYKHGRSSNVNNLKSLIYIAAEKGYNDIVKHLCKSYDAVDTINKGQIAMQAAIIGRDREFVIDLLNENKHLVKYEDDRGWTPLHHAAYYKFDSILHVILQEQLSLGFHAVNTENVPTPLHIAAKEGHNSTVMELLCILPSSSTAVVNHKGENILHILALQKNKVLIESILNVLPRNVLNQKDMNGNTPLHVLVREGCYVPELIIHEGVDKTAMNNQRWTPLDMLYFKEEMTGDQVRIKIAIDNTEAYRNILRSNVPPSRRLKKEPEFIRGKKLLIEEEIRRRREELKLVNDDLQHHRQMASTQIIVTALITTGTFTVGFTMPGGYHQSGEPDQGLVLLSKKTAFKAFVVSDALALMLSTSSLFLYFLASMYKDLKKVSALNAQSSGLNMLSLVAMMLTFVTGTYVVLSHSPALANTVCLICCYFFSNVIVQYMKMKVYDRKLEKNHEV